MITREHAAEVLAVIAEYDHRRVTERTVDTWHDHARRGGWTRDEAITAVHAHFAATRDTIYPADITERIRATRNLPPLPGQPTKRPCDLCDEYGWIKNSAELYGWVYRCLHDPNQRLIKKPADVHAAAQILREGRAREAADPRLRGAQR